MLKSYLLTLLTLLTIFDCSNKESKFKNGIESVTNMKIETINGKSVRVEMPNRIAHTYEQIIEGSIEQIFPLYCPVKELLWTESWNPKTVYSNSGLVEHNAIFTSKDGKRTATWYVTDYNIEKGHIEMIKFVPNHTVSKLEVNVVAITDTTTKAFISYGITSISDAGDEMLKHFTKENYDVSMQAWEKAMNYYLKTGEMLKGLPEF